MKKKPLSPKFQEKKKTLTEIIGQLPEESAEIISNEVFVQTQENLTLLAKYKLIKHTDEIKDSQPYSLLIRHPFINEEIKNYIKTEVIAEILGTKETLSLYENINILKTEIQNPKLAWSNYCAAKFPKQPKTIISITGTNGKTSTCSYIAQILTAMKIPNINISTVGTFVNNEKKHSNENSTPDAYIIHKALDEFAQKHPNGFAIIESTSIGIEEYRTHNITPNIAICTNITEDHLNYHKTMENYINAKFKLGKKAKKFYIHNSINKMYNIETMEGLENEMNPTFQNRNKQNDLQNNLAKIKENNEFSLKLGNIDSIQKPLKYINYGHELIAIKAKENSSIFTYKIDEKKHEISTDLLGKFNAENVLSAIIALKEFFKIEDFKNHIEKLKPAEGRLNRYKNLIVDFAHTVDAVDQIFKTINDYYAKRKIVVVGFAGFLKGQKEDYTRLNTISTYLEKNADIVILTTDNPRENDPLELALKSQKLCPKATIELNREEAIKKAYRLAKEGDVVLILGRGHQNVIELKDKKSIPYSDIEVVKMLTN